MVYSKPAGIDLHIHSNASDGTLSPHEILSLAQNLNLGAIAITDHDTIEGSRKAAQIGIPPSLKFLTGIEISAALPPPFEAKGSFHILGYAIDLDHGELNATLEDLQEARRNRNPRIIQRLRDCGFNISLADVEMEAGESLIGRPHIARVMVKKGFVKSIDEAFDKYIGHGKPAYADKYRLDCARAIEIIIKAGGIPVLAHPILVQTDSDKSLEALIARLKTFGLKGIEVYYPEHSPEYIAYYSELADRIGLLKTGGTDFHGDLKPGIKMGSGNGGLFVPYELYEKIVKSGSVQEVLRRGRKDLDELEQKLAYKFHRPDLLQEALCHSSFVNEQEDGTLQDNERLEFLGDAVINLVAGDLLMQKHPNLNEGDLSKMRANLVNEGQLAEIAKTIDLGTYIFLGKGEVQTNGQGKKSILSDAFEAVIAAVYTDGGFEAAYRIVSELFGPLIDATWTTALPQDCKSQLQELTQVRQKGIPSYRVVQEEGPDHDKTFHVQIMIDSLQMEGSGKSKKAAEQDAARKVLEILMRETNG
ncbi:MAG: ribonuclease III [Desulfobacterales bacterium]|nr:ribonuclease III [Desulfobacterales bacterium]